MNKIELLEKLRRVVDSCQTHDQLDSAEMYAVLWVDSYPVDHFCDYRSIERMVDGIIGHKRNQLRLS